ncbi:MAG: enoyl-CoA hydratase, partial [Actinomycetota bacterium]
AELLHRANVDDDVKVLVIRGEGEDFGTGQDLPEFMEAVNSEDGLLREVGLEGEDVVYPPKRNFRHGAFTTQAWFTDPRGGCRTLQEFKKISIVEAKGYVYGWHFYQAGDADLVISSDDALFGHAAFRYAGAAPRMWWWAQMMGMRKFMEMVFTGRPFTAAEMAEVGFCNSVVPRDQLEAEVQKYALACASNRSNDTIFVQKAFFEVMKQSQGEYMGSLISGMLESLTSYSRPDRSFDKDGEMSTNEAIDKGLTNAVKDFDNRFPPEWRLSRKGRAAPE